jgi:hypothetical protein
MENKYKVLDTLYFEVIDKYNEFIAKLKEYLADGKERQLLLDMDEEGVPYSYVDEDNNQQDVQLSKIRYNKEDDHIEVFDIFNNEWLFLIELGMDLSYDIVTTIQWKDN